MVVAEVVPVSPPNWAVCGTESEVRALRYLHFTFSIFQPESESVEDWPHVR